MQMTSDPDAGKIWLSVITPVLNGEQYIGGCIENVAGQRTEGIEQIIMDGMSTDGTVAIAERYARANPWVRVISEKDGSQAAAMNRGIQLARGPVLGFLNADDYYEPNVLNRVEEIFKGLAEPSLVVANCNVRDEAGEIIVVNRPSRLTLLEFIKGHEYPWNPSAYFYHKSLHDLAGFYDANEHYVMDVDFLMKAVQKANALYVDEVWGNFRWMKGTKTFDDAKAGRMDQRLARLRKKYTGDLSFLERVDLGLFGLARAVYRGVKAGRDGR